MQPSPYTVTLPSSHHASWCPFHTHVTNLTFQSSLPHPAQASTDLLSVSLSLPFLGSSQKWNHTRWSLLCLAAFTSYNVFWGSLFYTTCLPVPFDGWMVFHCGMYHVLFIHPPADCTFGMFPVSWDVMKNAPINIHMLSRYVDIC